MNEILYHHLCTAQVVDAVQIMDKNTTIDEIIGFILNDAPMWFHDGEIYHLVVGFKDDIDSLTVYYSNSDGTVSTIVYGGEQ